MRKETHVFWYFFMNRKVHALVCFLSLVRNGLSRRDGPPAILKELHEHRLFRGFICVCGAVRMRV